jgi:hypothetical protein
MSRVILFWFLKPTMNPISLYELGRHAANKDKKLFVGVEPGYARELDVKEQLRLARPEVKVVSSLEDLYLAWKQWVMREYGKS